MVRRVGSPAVAARTRWRVAAWLCVGAVALLLAGCQRADGETVIRFWAMGREAEVVGELVREFERDNPGIRVRIQQIPWTSAHEKLLTAYAADALPDVCQLGNTLVPEFATLGALEPLGTRVEASPVIDADDYFPGIWATNIVDGELLGVPWYVDTRLLFYRRDILAAAGWDAPPRDWAEWAQAMADVKAHVGPDRYAIMVPLNEFEQLLSFALQQDDPLLRDGGTRGNFASPGFRRALGFYAGLFENGWAPPMSESQISNVWDEFGNGYFSFYISGPWNIAEFQKRLPPSVADQWMTMPLPGPDGPGASVAGGTSFVVFRDSRHKAAAWKLIAYLSSPEVQEQFYTLTHDLPPRRSPWRSPALAADPYARAYRDQLERAVPTPKVPEWERIATELRLVGELLANDRLTVDEAAAELDRRTDAILEKRRWLLDRARAGR